MRKIILHKNAIHTGSLILVNRAYPYMEQAASPLLAAIGNQNQDILLEQRALVLLTELMEKIKGWPYIVPVSGWRSKKEQQNIWEQSLKEHGAEFTKKYVALPGHSEHQTGLAIDLGLNTEHIDFICPSFPSSGICQTFRTYAPYYGFVERYPKGKEAVTGIGYEPWHFRFAGYPHSVIMAEYHLTMEEYLDFLKKFTYGKHTYEYKNNRLHAAISFLPVSPGTIAELEISEHVPCSISGNNTDGIIIAEWRRSHVPVNA